MRVVKAERPGHLLVRAAFHFPAPGTAAFLQFTGTMPWLLRIRGSIFPQNGYFKPVRQVGYRKYAKNGVTWRVLVNSYKHADAISHLSLHRFDYME